MPIYEYRCQDCGKITEILVWASNQQSDLNCAYCQSTNLIRVPSAPAGFLFDKGSEKGLTCCGREERCEKPPCSDSEVCRKE